MNEPAPLISIPAALLSPLGNVLDLTLRGHAPGEVGSRLRAGGLSALRLGTYETLERESRLRLA